MTKPNPKWLRTVTITEKIPTHKTGFKSSIFVHVDCRPTSTGNRILGVRLNEKGKDGSTLDRLLTAIGDSVTDIIRKEITGA